MLMERLDMDEDEENTIVRFLHGLNIYVVKRVEMQEYGVNASYRKGWNK